MRSRVELAEHLLEEAKRMLLDHVRGLRSDEAIETGGGYRSIMGLLKHVAGWTVVYHSYAFDDEPRHWRDIDWPHGLRDEVELSQAYLDDLVTWLESSCERWGSSVRALRDDDLDRPRPVHWGGELPLFDIVVITAQHWDYHAGEINALLAIHRGEAWEFGEEVEENHVATAGHGVRPAWMTDEEAQAYQEAIGRRGTA